MPDLDDLTDPLANNAINKRIGRPATQPTTINTNIDACDDETTTVNELRKLPPAAGLRMHHHQLTSRSVVPTSFLGLQWAHGMIGPNSGASLARWQPTDAGLQPPPPPQLEPLQERVSREPGPRLAVACMVRAAPLPAVDGFLRYYHAIGFERIVLCFDQPHEDAEAISLARRHEAEVGGVVIHECDAAWWDEERRTGRAFVRARAAREEVRKARGSSHDPSASKTHNVHSLKRLLDEQEVALFESTNDVQTRQSLVMDRAIRDAWADGFDWLLQLDVDELLYLPRACEREDARAYFASVPRE